MSDTTLHKYRYNPVGTTSVPISILHRFWSVSHGCLFGFPLISDHLACFAPEAIVQTNACGYYTLRMRYDKYRRMFPNRQSEKCDLLGI